MSCVICKGQATAPGLVTVTLERGPVVAVIKLVPASVCQDCGEYTLDLPTTERVLAIGEEAVKHKVEIEVVRYAA